MRNRSFVKDAKGAKTGLLLGYARVSKGDEQNNVLQTSAFIAACLSDLSQTRYRPLIDSMLRRHGSIRTGPTSLDPMSVFGRGDPPH